MGRLVTGLSLAITLASYGCGEAHMEADRFGADGSFTGLAGPCADRADCE